MPITRTEARWFVMFIVVPSSAVAVPVKSANATSPLPVRSWLNVSTPFAYVNPARFVGLKEETSAPTPCLRCASTETAVLPLPYASAGPPRVRATTTASCGAYAVSAAARVPSSHTIP